MKGLLLLLLLSTVLASALAEQDLFLVADQYAQSGDIEQMLATYEVILQREPQNCD